MNLKSLGEHVSIWSALDLLNNVCKVEPPVLQLTTINTIPDNDTQPQEIIKNCSILEKLVLGELFRLVSPTMLHSFSSTITKLHLKHIHTNHRWIKSLYTYLSRRESQCLFFDRFQDITFDLNSFLFKLININTLVIEGIRTTFKPPYILNKTFRNLKKLRLYSIDDSIT